MSTRFWVIGIGSGNPDHLSIAGMRALLNAQAVVYFDKGESTQDLEEVREKIINHFAPEITRLYIPDPPRDRHPIDYDAEVRRWHGERRKALAEKTSQYTEVAILVWGDPSLYDSTLRLLEPMGVDIEVIPGITAISALCAAHKICLNTIGAPVHITTGRLLREEYNRSGHLPGYISARNRQEDNSVPNPDRTIVMLDGHNGWENFPDAYIWWGAYVGMPNEVLMKGYVSEIGEKITAMKQALRKQHGWIMDIYLLEDNS